MWGIVSNCWRTQFEAGEPLESLLDEGLRRGFQWVELRQGCLGRFEQDGLPVPESLEELSASHAQLQFNLAMSLPYLCELLSPDDSRFETGVRAAQALAGERLAHLRLVDPASRQMLADGPNLARLSRVLIGVGGKLSLENAPRPWQAFRDVFDAAQNVLGDAAGALQLCYDPCNLLGIEAGRDLAAVTSSLAPAELAMVHAKQSAGGSVLTYVGGGDVDWRAQCRALRDIGYRGSVLFEIGPHQNIWDSLERSRHYLKNAGCNWL